MVGALSSRPCARARCFHGRPYGQRRWESVLVFSSRASIDLIMTTSNSGHCPINVAPPVVFRDLVLLRANVEINLCDGAERRFDENSVHYKCRSLFLCAPSNADRANESRGLRTRRNVRDGRSGGEDIFARRIMRLRFIHLLDSGTSVKFHEIGLKNNADAR